jgi:hypothetical protein
MKAMENDTGLWAKEKIIGINREIDRHIAVVAAGKLEQKKGESRSLPEMTAPA